MPEPVEKRFLVNEPRNGPPPRAETNADENMPPITHLSLPPAKQFLFPYRRFDIPTEIQRYEDRALRIQPSSIIPGQNTVVLTAPRPAGALLFIDGTPHTLTRPTKQSVQVDRIGDKDIHLDPAPTIANLNHCCTDTLDPLGGGCANVIIRTMRRSDGRYCALGFLSREVGPNDLADDGTIELAFDYASTEWALAGNGARGVACRCSCRNGCRGVIKGFSELDADERWMLISTGRLADHLLRACVLHHTA